MLIRQVLARLAAKGLIYRLHGKGTFIAPRPRTDCLLVVHHDDDPVRHPHVSQLSFALGQAWASSGQGPVRTMAAEEFLSARLDELPLIFPGLRGILFFRETAPVARAVAEGLHDRIPCAFLGSSSHRERVAIPARWHEEARIASLMAELLKGRRVAVLGTQPAPGESPAHPHRLTSLARATGAREVIALPPVGFDRALEARLRSPRVFNALACVHDWVAARALHGAKRLGLAVPGDLAIAGINGDAGGAWLDPPLSSVVLDLTEDARVLSRYFAASLPKKLDPRGSLKLKRSGSA
ncbi:MAG: substrate-binding domain-containing protein [Spirochaetes bacterium]|nr:substrate-binding domain-containing protein [Spirochaetota bacterium]